MTPERVEMLRQSVRCLYGEATAARLRAGFMLAQADDDDDEGLKEQAAECIARSEAYEYGAKTLDHYADDMTAKVTK